MAWTETNDVFKDIRLLSHMNKETPQHDNKVPELLRTNVGPTPSAPFIHNPIMTSPPVPLIGRGRAAISLAAKAKVDALNDPYHEIYGHLRATIPVSYSNENIEKHFGTQVAPVPNQFDDSPSRNVLLNSLAKKREKKMSLENNNSTDTINNDTLSQEAGNSFKGFSPKKKYTLESKSDFPALK